MERAEKSSNGVLIIKGQLSKIGNQKPYFAITADLYEKGCWEAGGCLHELIVELAPDLADFIALHLSDEDGVPMYAVENGWYWNGGTKYQAYDRNILAKHLRVSLEEADRVHKDCTTKEQFAAYVDTQRPRWKAEADAVIVKYGLR